MLRTALGLSLATQTPFRITRIRGNRPKPGLLRQHLTCVQAAAALSDAEVEGAVLGSSELVFHPQTLKSGVFEFSIGSAGSTTLVLQAVLPGLLCASGPTTVAIEGGTHNGLAPPFEFLAHSFLPVLSKLGAQVEVRLARHGFEPAGGGRLEISVKPAPLQPYELLERGRLLNRHATAVLAGLAPSIGQRELDVVRDELDFAAHELGVQSVTAPSQGNALILSVGWEHVTDVVVGLGARGITAEKVARHACGEVKRALRSDAPVGLHLADQLLVPMALAGKGSFRTVTPTLHTRTQLDLIPRFVEVKLHCHQEPSGSWRVDVES